MKWALLVGILVLQVVEPPVLPAGHYCAHVTRDRGPAHACACQRECVPSTDEDGHPTVVVREDATCAQYCHADHCHCPAKGCD